MPFVPYFLSTLDALTWRYGIAEAIYPETYMPGQREIGDIATNNWGSVYPRQGFLSQPHDFKHAAVTAQRAADIVTRRGQPHVYLELLRESSQGYWPPAEVIEGDKSTHKWQLLYPQMEMKCGVFPVDSTPIDEQGNYAWALWRPYKCCRKSGDRLITYTGN